MYVRDYSAFPPVVLSAIGFRAHGKTVYFATLFKAMAGLAELWPGFATQPLNEETLQTVYGNVEMLAEGNLPDATPKNFPRPALLRLRSVPMQPDCTLLCYDTGGECFERPTQLVQYGGFVRRARSAVFLVSLPVMADAPKQMHRLLNVYAIGMGELGANTKDQHLIVVYSRADELASRLEAWPDLWSYLAKGGSDGLMNPAGYIGKLCTVSDRLRQFTEEEVRAHEFLNAASEEFRSVSFCIVSSLGAKPVGRRLLTQIAPRRVLDPMFWVAQRSLSGWRQAWRRWTQ
ncbi:MAG: hypothetical protein M1570_02870 [Chloroflexi bacterium]|nr:hypothetical protein [Chloroflexota bacterium]